MQTPLSRVPFAEAMLSRAERLRQAIFVATSWATFPNGAVLGFQKTWKIWNEKVGGRQPSRKKLNATAPLNKASVKKLTEQRQVQLGSLSRQN